MMLLQLAFLLFFFGTLPAFLGLAHLARKRFFAGAALIASALPSLLFFSSTPGFTKATSLAWLAFLFLLATYFWCRYPLMGRSEWWGHGLLSLAALVMSFILVCDLTNFKLFGFTDDTTGLAAGLVVHGLMVSVLKAIHLLPGRDAVHESHS
jgi:hypothetical protein